ncbi:hypothetical protein BJ508DRAFT_308877 [Ascobolus immersus RN42]|uniref:Uncharacterized protein n=1 Tax=Ascobolus immersus RN42 TaxID=1160509 RepID=A0A3N4I0B2_ASCIM|nr:hypothetical protein BJ508DRAFT_308877 [Ascobolus immersus RN42]
MVERDATRGRHTNLTMRKVSGEIKLMYEKVPTPSYLTKPAMYACFLLFYKLYFREDGLSKSAERIFSRSLLAGDDERVSQRGERQNSSDQKVIRVFQHLSSTRLAVRSSGEDTRHGDPLRVEYLKEESVRLIKSTYDPDQHEARQDFKLDRASRGSIRLLLPLLTTSKKDSPRSQVRRARARFIVRSTGEDDGESTDTSFNRMHWRRPSSDVRWHMGMMNEYLKSQEESVPNFQDDVRV